MFDLVHAGSQFVLATHSPLLMALPGARLYEFSAQGPTSVAWADVDTVRITADFLDDPTGFLDELLVDDADDPDE